MSVLHGDCLALLDELDPADFAVLVTDPPYGIGYESGSRRRDGNARSIVGDEDTSLRDAILEWWGDRPALVFGSWRREKPAGTKGTLIWDKGGALGMGDLSLPWKFDHEEIYVLGHGFVGKRDSGSVIRIPPEQSTGRCHPHQKPVELMTRLLVKCPPGPVLDPFCGSGSTLVAAKKLGRPFLGIEKDVRYIPVCHARLAQGVLELDGAA